MAKKYYITQEQLENLDHYKYMLNQFSEQIELLCREEQHDIVYGFQLGRLHTTLRNNYIEMMDTLLDIQGQKIEDEK